MPKKARKKDKKASVRKTKANAPTPFDLLHLTVEFLKARIATLEAKITAIEKDNRVKPFNGPDKTYWPCVPTTPFGPAWTSDNTMTVPLVDPPKNTTVTPIPRYKPSEVVGPGRNTLK
jgi:hypothetical protein